MILTMSLSFVNSYVGAFHNSNIFTKLSYWTVFTPVIWCSIFPVMFIVWRSRYTDNHMPFLFWNFVVSIFLLVWYYTWLQNKTNYGNEYDQECLFNSSAFDVHACQGNFLMVLYENGKIDAFWFFHEKFVKLLFNIIQAVIQGLSTVWS